VYEKICCVKRVHFNKEVYSFLTIYVDQMFLENFIMNYIILYITVKISGVQSKWYRIIIGAIIGAIYVIFSYIFDFYNNQPIIIKILLSVIMIFTSFKIKNIKIFLKTFISFFGITLFIGGASFGLAFLLNVSMISEGGILYVEEFPIMMVALGTFAAVISIQLICIFLKTKLKINALLYNVEIKFFDKKIVTTVLLDSGHNVKERFTGYPVIILENSILKEIVPNEVIEKIGNNNFEFDEKWKRRLRLIPISTVSDRNEVLIGFKVDEATIYVDGGRKVIKNIIIAGCDRKLDREDNYFALMGNILE